MSITFDELKAVTKAGEKFINDAYRLDQPDLHEKARAVYASLSLKTSPAHSSDPAKCVKEHLALAHYWMGFSLVENFRGRELMGKFAYTHLQSAETQLRSLPADYPKRSNLCARVSTAYGRLFSTQGCDSELCAQWDVRSKIAEWSTQAAAS